MKFCSLLLAVLAVGCRSAEPDRQGDPVNPADPAPLGTEAREAFDLILYEINAGKDPVGHLSPIPRTTGEAVAGVQDMDLAGTSEEPPSVVEYNGFFVCSWAPLDSPLWGQSGYAVHGETGAVYRWSLW